MLTAVPVVPAGQSPTCARRATTSCSAMSCRTVAILLLRLRLDVGRHQPRRVILVSDLPRRPDHGGSIYAGAKTADRDPHAADHPMRRVSADTPHRRGAQSF